MRFTSKESDAYRLPAGYERLNMISAKPSETPATAVIINQLED